MYRRHYIKGRFYRDRRGVSVIEFALIAPFILSLVLGVMELGIIIFTQFVIDDATRIASRLGRTGDDYGSDRRTFIVNYIVQQGGGLLNANNVSVNSLVLNDINLLQRANFENFNFTDNRGNLDLGVGGDVVAIGIRYQWPVRTPLLQLTLDPFYDITAITFVNNERFN